MQKILLLFATFSITLNIYEQDSKVSATLSYPLTIGDNFLNEYSGYLDVGLQYRFLQLEPFNFGISVNTSMLRVSNREDEGDKLSALLIHPKLFGEFLIGPNGKLRPSFGVGYGFNKFNNQSNATREVLSHYNQVFEGVLINLTVAYHISKHLFILAQYDRAKIKRSFVELGDQNFNHSGTLLKIGVGYNF